MPFTSSAGEWAGTSPRPATSRETLAVAFGCEVDVVLGPARDDSANAILVVGNEAPPVDFDVEVKATLTPTTAAALAGRTTRRLVLFTPRLTCPDVLVQLSMGGSLPASAVRQDGCVQSRDISQLDEELRRASTGSDEEYVVVLERVLAVCATDPAVAEELDELDLHSELADVYDRLGRVEEALDQVDVLVERGYRCSPDPRCRRAEILMRHGRVSEAAPIWSEVLRDWPEDVWVFNNAGLEYGAIGEHEVALDWSTRGLELALRTGDPERLVPQLRRLRAESLSALGRAPDALQVTEPMGRPKPPPGFRAVPTPATSERAAGHRGTDVAVAYAWLPADEFALVEQQWPDIAAQESVRDDSGALVDHAEYCRRFERTLHEAADSGLRRVRIATLRRTAFDAWVTEAERSGEGEAALRAGYAAELNRRRVDLVAWPPGRNERCWCGSGVKYKKCCSAPMRT